MVAKGDNFHSFWGKTLPFSFREGKAAAFFHVQQGSTRASPQEPTEVDSSCAGDKPIVAIVRKRSRVVVSGSRHSFV